jgi:hypothetical protein
VPKASVLHSQHGATNRIGRPPRQGRMFRPCARRHLQKPFMPNRRRSSPFSRLAAFHRATLAPPRPAQRQGVSVGDYLIGHGSLTADTLYRCVAQHLGVPFLSRKLPLRDHIDPHTAARQGFAPLVPQHAGGARAVVASRSRTRTADQPRVAKRLSSSTCLPRSNGWTIRAPSSIRRSSSKRTICRRSPRSRRCAAAFLSRFVVALPARHVRSRAR